MKDALVLAVLFGAIVLIGSGCVVILAEAAFTLMEGTCP